MVVLINSICIARAYDSAICCQSASLVGCSGYLATLTTFNRNNIRVPGIYHHLGTDEEANFRRSLNLITTTWGNQALAAEQSCGSMMEVGSGGKGSLFVCTFEFGPFQGQ